MSEKHGDRYLINSSGSKGDESTVNMSQPHQAHTLSHRKLTRGKYIKEILMRVVTDINFFMFFSFNFLYLENIF
jgi:hypothetical protein